MSSSPGYDEIPDLPLIYDALPLYAARSDIGFYVEEARRAQGRVLELGCGTGRVLLPIAREGFAITGVDASQKMLERCAAKLAADEPRVRERVELHRSDVRELSLDGRYDLVIAPFRVVQHLTSIEDQLRFLERVAVNLAPGGRFVFDAFNPSFAALLSHDGAEHEDTAERVLPDGRAFRRAYRIASVRWLDQVSETELIYYVASSPGAAAQRYVQRFDMRWYLRTELVHLLARAGFAISEIHGDFARGPLTDDSPEIVIAARLAA